MWFAAERRLVRLPNRCLLAAEHRTTGDATLTVAAEESALRTDRAESNATIARRDRAGVAASPAAGRCPWAGHPGHA